MWSKEKREIGTSILKKRQLVQDCVRITHSRKRNEKFKQYFSESDGYIYCNNVEGLFGALNYPFDPQMWRLSIDSNKNSLKCLLLHNESKSTKPAIPLVYGDESRKREDYASMNKIVDLIQYNKFKWFICSDLKVATLCRGLKQGRPHHMCIFCDWLSTTRDFDILWSKEWTARNECVVGQLSVSHEPAVKELDKFWAPPLHVKLGLCHKFIEILFKRRKQKIKNKEPGAEEEYEQLSNFLSKLFGKTKNYVETKAAFTGPEIRKLMIQKNDEFCLLLDADEIMAWICFKSVDENFFGNKRSANYRNLVNDLLDSFKDLGISCTYKIHLLNCHLDKFPPDCGAQGDQQGEHAHQIFRRSEERYRGSRQGERGIAFLSDHVASTSSSSSSNMNYGRQIPGRNQK